MGPERVGGLAACPFCLSIFGCSSVRCLRPLFFPSGVSFVSVSAPLCLLHLIHPRGGLVQQRSYSLLTVQMLFFIVLIVDVGRGKRTENERLGEGPKPRRPQGRLHGIAFFQLGVPYIPISDHNSVCSLLRVLVTSTAVEERLSGCWLCPVHVDAQYHCCPSVALSFVYRASTPIDTFFRCVASV